MFNRRYVCRLEPWPEPLQRAFALMQEDPTVYGTMIGPSEFHVTGTLKDWDITERLAEIATPTLLISGLHDEATPRIVEEIHRRIAGASWELFEASSHTPHLEEPERFLRLLRALLRRRSASESARRLEPADQPVRDEHGRQARIGARHRREHRAVGDEAARRCRARAGARRRRCPWRRCPAGW